MTYQHPHLHLEAARKGFEGQELRVTHSISPDENSKVVCAVLASDMLEMKIESPTLSAGNT
jgi:hypothetical protein